MRHRGEAASRRRRAGSIVSAAVLGVSLALVACASIASPALGASQRVAARSATAYATPTAVSAAELTTLFASEGIATLGSMSASTPVEAVTGPVIMRFTTDQVRTMAEEASAGSGLRGAALDAAHPVPAGVLPLSYLLAAWVSSGRSAGAAEIRSLMGRQDWSAAPRLTFPVVALPLFTAEVIAAVHAGSSSPSATSRLIGSAPRRVVLVNFINSPCSTVTSFIDDFMSTVFDALTLTEPQGATLGSKVGKFFVDTWNTGVGYAQKAVHGLLKTVTEAVIKQIENEAAGAAVIAEVITNIGPWTATVTAIPPSIGLGEMGSFKVKVTSALGVDDYPAPIKDCADKLGFTLPALNAKGASAKWSLSSPLSPTSDTAVELDDNASSTVTYTTEPKSSSSGGGCSGGSPSSPAPGPESATGTVTVTRPAVGDIKGLLANLLSTNIPVVGGIVHRILQPLIDEVVGQLDALSQVTGSAKVSITNAKESGSGAGGCPPSKTKPKTTAQGGVCMVGSWSAANVSISQESGTGRLNGGRGAKWVIQADGTETIDWDGSGEFSATESGVTLNLYRYEGSEAERVKIESGSSGIWRATVTSDDRTATTNSPVPGGGSVPSTAGLSETGSWTCSGNAMTIDVDVDGSAIDVSLVRQ